MNSIIMHRSQNEKFVKINIAIIDHNSDLRRINYYKIENITIQSLMYSNTTDNKTEPIGEYLELLIHLRQIFPL